MHIVQINYAYHPADRDPEALLERFSTLTGWSETLLEAGADQVTVAQRFHRALRLERNGVAYLFFTDKGRPHPSMWTLPDRLHQAVTQLEPDVAHVNGLIFPRQTFALRRILPRRTALAVQDHGGESPDLLSSPLLAQARRTMYRRGLGAADAFLFTAQAQAYPWRAAGLIASAQPVYEVPESSRSLRPLPCVEARAITGMYGDPAVLWVGHLNSNKDPLTVLTGFEQALPGLPGAHLTMIYVGADLLPEVEARLAAAPAVAEHVHLVGPVPHDKMAAFFSAAEVFLSSSHREGSGYALIEALACGLAPVVTDIPSFRVLTANGQLGALWPPGDPMRLAAALVDVGRRDVGSLRSTIAAYFERALNWPAIGRRAMAVYREIQTRRLSAV